MRHRSLKHRLTADQGVSVVEFALVVPILMMVVFAAIDFTRAYFTQNQVASAARAGARFAAVQSNPMASQAQIRQVVRQFGAQLGGPGITDDQIQIALNNATGEVTVSIVGYPFSLITPLARTVGVGTIPITKRATFRWEWS
ncbi:MAG TPA: TadE family protein [Gemmatimonadaceae bacterium]|nr:TadE family protein [Gemmatimonadaceae bacterium]